MTLEVVLSPRAQRDIAAALPEKVATACVEFIFGPLAENPRRVGKPLGGALEGRWAARRGEYRVVYEIHDDRVVVVVVTVAHRRDAYRR